MGRIGRIGRIGLTALLPLLALVTLHGAPVLAQERDPEAGGTGVVMDADARSDKITVTVQRLPLPTSGQEYHVRLIDGSGNSTDIGVLAVDGNGNGSLSYTDPERSNLVGGFVGLTVTLEPDGRAVLSHSIPPGGLRHIRHLLYAFEPDPEGRGILPGLVSELKTALDHGRLSNESAGNLALMQRHAEHVVNILEGPGGANFGDLDGDGRIETFGERVGALEFARDAQAQARLAMQGAPGDGSIQLHGRHVLDSTRNVINRATAARDAALRILDVRDTDTGRFLARLETRNVLRQIETSIQGIDLNGDDVIAPVRGEGGAQTAYRHAQFMATYTLEVGEPAPVQLPAVGGSLYGSLWASWVLGAAILVTVGGLALWRRRQPR